MDDMDTSRNSDLIATHYLVRSLRSRCSLKAVRAPHRVEHHPFLGRAVRQGVIFVLACFSFHALAGSSTGEDKAQLCLLCHKPAADKRFVALLEQQPADYLVAATMAYKTGQRKETSMNVNAANLSEADIRDISGYFASKEFPKRAQNLEPAKIAAGEKVVTDMNCASCHGPTFRGAGMTPRLAGQNVMYLVGQMEAFRDGRRNLPPGMAVLKDRTDIENGASYLASFP